MIDVAFDRVDRRGQELAGEARRSLQMKLILSCPGDDLDLWTPDWGHVLIINQDLNPEPNDNPWGGEMILDFSAIGPVTMTSLRALDIDIYEGASWIMLYDGEGNELYRVQLQNLGNMSQQDVDLGNTEGVMTMKVVLDGRNEHGMLAGSGAIDNIKFCITEMVESPCVMPTATIQAKAWPMPFTDRTTIEFTASETQDYVVHLYDSRGRMIRELKAGNAKAGVSRRYFARHERSCGAARQPLAVVRPLHGSSEAVSQP